jgi:hypothetical protein
LDSHWVVDSLKSIRIWYELIHIYDKSNEFFVPKLHIVSTLFLIILPFLWNLLFILFLFFLRYFFFCVFYYSYSSFIILLFLLYFFFLLFLIVLFLFFRYFFTVFLIIFTACFVTLTLSFVLYLNSCRTVQNVTVLYSSLQSNGQRLQYIP